MIQATPVDRRRALSGLAMGTAVEVLCVAVVFALYTGQLPPDVNESHYLTKARHFWDATWCPNDLFLSSEFSHWLFYAITGWLTRWCSLETYAWIGRIGVWLLLAIAWRRLVHQVTGARWMAALMAPLWLLLLDRGHLAGEWVVGGFEAKGFAYALVLWSLSELAAGRWTRVWICLGLAAAFHLLVGFWAGVAAWVAWFGAMGPAPAANACRTVIPFGRWPVGSWLIAVGLATPGWLPPLLSRLSVAPETVLLASQVQVGMRLSHHQFFPAFGVERVAAFVVLLGLWFAVRWSARRLTSWHGLDRFAVAALWMNIAGIVLSAWAARGGAGQDVAWSLLRLYWFRLADVAVPISLCVMLGALLAHSGVLSRPWTFRGGWLIACIAMVWLAYALVVSERWRDSRPRADQAALPNYPGEWQRTVATYENWMAVCRWIREQTPRDAGFLTPPQQQTFKWYAHRREVFCWKDMPQDDARIAAWWDRSLAVYFNPRDWPRGWFDYSDDELIALGKQYGATYLVLPQRDYESRPTGLRLCYPSDPHRRSTYVVLALDATPVN